MKKSDNPLRLNVGYLYHKPIGSIREIPVEVDQVQVDDLTISDLKGVIRLSRTREGILLQINLGASVNTDCVRCLDEFFMPVETEFEELYQFPSRYREDTDLILPDDGYLDLQPLLREYLILALPIKPLCQMDCVGLCDVCGVNLNDKSCQHQAEADIKPDSVESEETA